MPEQVGIEEIGLECAVEAMRFEVDLSTGVIREGVHRAHDAGLGLGRGPVVVLGGRRVD